MTRINVLPPALLTDAHLLAEYRELPRVFTLARGSTGGPTPSRYTLGTGHVRFFYSRTGFLARRQAELIRELLDRGYNLTHRTAPEPIPGLDLEWEPDEVAISVNRARLQERLRKEGARYTHRGKPVGLDFYDDRGSDNPPCVYS